MTYNEAIAIIERPAGRSEDDKIEAAKIIILDRDSRDPSMVAMARRVVDVIRTRRYAVEHSTSGNEHQDRNS
jgi:hypothetical protein